MLRSFVFSVVFFFFLNISFNHQGSLAETELIKQIYIKRRFIGLDYLIWSGSPIIAVFTLEIVNLVAGQFMRLNVFGVPIWH